MKLTIPTIRIATPEKSSRPAPGTSSVPLVSRAPRPAAAPAMRAPFVCLPNGARQSRPGAAVERTADPSDSHRPKRVIPRTRRARGVAPARAPDRSARARRVRPELRARPDPQHAHVDAGRQLLRRAGEALCGGGGVARTADVQREVG